MRQVVNLQTGEITLEDDAPPSPQSELTLDQQAELVRQALQQAIDEKARSFGFSSGDSIIQYAGFVNKWQSFALTFANWEVQIWDEADAYKADVIAGIKPMLTGDEAVALMPEYPS